MADEWQGIFTDAVKPVGMWYPLHVQVLGNIYKLPQLFFLCLQVVKDYTIINTLHRCFYTLSQVIQFSSFLYKVGNANRLNAQVILCAVKINPGFLFMRLYFQQYNLF